MGSTVVLLGAGASVDAGLPTSYQLTENIVRRVQEDPRLVRGGEVAALNHAVGAIIAHDARAGGDPYSGIDVERVFSAIQMLSERDALEVSPFVSGWTDPRMAPSQRLPAFWGRALGDFVGNSLSGSYARPSTHALEKEFAEGVRALTDGGVDIVNSYKRLTRELPRTLIDLLRPVEPGRFDYLSALFDVADIRIATLNYDLGIETAAARSEFPVDTGISAWGGGYDWSWLVPDALPLLKLHGSLDWWYEQPDAEVEEGALWEGVDCPPRSVQPPRRVRQHDGPPAGSDYYFLSQPEPAMIFGARQKLRADGPFLAMLFEFSRWISAAEHLVIVGYSFRDDHINVILNEWVASRPQARLSIIDPGFLHDRAREMSPFGASLLRDLTWYDMREGGSSQPRLRRNSTVINLGAAQGLRELVDSIK